MNLNNNAFLNTYEKVLNFFNEHHLTAAKIYSDFK